MKKLMPKLNHLLIVIFLISNISCQNEDFEEFNQPNKKIEYKKIKDLPDVEVYLKNLKEINISIRRNEEDSLNLDLENILEYTDDYGKKSYSINVIKQFEENENFYIENFSIVKVYEEFLGVFIKYEPENNPEEIKKENFTGRITYYNINKEEIAIEDFVNGARVCYKPMGCVLIGWDDATGTIVSLNFSGCESGSNGGGGPSIPGGTPGGGPSSGGGPGSSNSNTTTHVIPLLGINNNIAFTNSYLNALLPDVRNFISSSQNYYIRKALYSYLALNNYSGQSLEFAWSFSSLLKEINATNVNVAAIFDFLKVESNNSIAIQDALLTVLTTHSSTEWQNNSGLYNNITALPYVKTRTLYSNNRPLYQYRLANGDVINTGDYSSNSDNTLIKTYYWSALYGPAWFQIPFPSSYSSLSLDFLFNQFWSNVQTGVRYCTPLEDVVILIDGRDFESVEQSRAVAGVFFLIDIIPIGKVFKVVKKAGAPVLHSLPVVKRVLTTTAKAQRAVRKQYRYVITTMSNSQKGNFGEICAELDLYEKGYDVLNATSITSINQAGHNGIDHVIRNSQTGEFLIVESKYVNVPLAAANETTNLAKQLSDLWILGTVPGQPYNRLLTALGGNNALYQQVIANYKRVVARVQTDGTVIYKYVDAAGIELSTIFTP